MASLKNIKLKILSYKKTGTVTHAMEAVSAVKMRKSQERAINVRPYARAGLRILGALSESVDAQQHALAAERSQGKIGILLITSDKGLAGNLNSAVIKQTSGFIRDEGISKENLVLICLGKRGYEFAIRNGYEVAHHHTNISDGIEESEVRAITEIIVDLQTRGITREFRVAYTNFRSTFEQEAAIHKILPLSQKVLDAIVAGITPERGKFAEIAQQNGGRVAAYTIEPEATEVLSVLFPKLVNVAVYHKILESKASEHSARMVAMKSATDKAEEMAHDLTRKFNKVRQASITREVSEITSGIEAMR